MQEFIIKKNIRSQEIGGVMVGKFLNQLYPRYEIKKLLYFRNRAKVPQMMYQLPSKYIIALRLLPYIWRGYTVIGEFHSHIWNKDEAPWTEERGRKPSQADLEAISVRLKKVKEYLLGIVCNGKMNIYYYNEAMKL